MLKKNITFILLVFTLSACDNQVSEKQSSQNKTIETAEVPKKEINSNPDLAKDYELKQNSKKLSSESLRQVLKNSDKIIECLSSGYSITNSQIMFYDLDFTSPSLREPIDRDDQHLVKDLTYDKDSDIFSWSEVLKKFESLKHDYQLHVSKLLLFAKGPMYEVNRIECDDVTAKYK